jgi:hypothetical protein
MKIKTITKDEHSGVVIIPDVSVFASDELRSGKDWGEIYLTPNELIFNTKSQFRSIGTYGAAGAPIIGLFVGIKNLLKLLIGKAASTTDPLPSIDELKQNPSATLIPYNTVDPTEVQIRDLGGPFLELKYGCVFELTVPKKHKSELRKNGYRKAELKEKYAEMIRDIFQEQSGVEINILPAQTNEYFKRLLFGICMVGLPLTLSVGLDKGVSLWLLAPIVILGVMVAISLWRSMKN